MSAPDTPTPAEADEHCGENTDHELFRETPGDAYAPSLHVTKQGGIGINVGGLVFVKPLRAWHGLAVQTEDYVQQRIAAACAEKDKRIVELEKEIDSHAWDISPAMAHAKIDELNATLTTLRDQLARARQLHEQEVNEVRQERDKAVEYNKKTEALLTEYWKLASSVSALQVGNPALKKTYEEFKQQARAALDAAKGTQP